MTRNKNLSLPLGRIASSILVVRGHRVLLDADLAALYGVTTRRLNEQVRRNCERFPEDFVFQLSQDGHEALRSQFATSNAGRGGWRYLPYAFTEHGAIMAAAVLNTPRAVEMSLYVVRTFVRLREMLASNKELKGKLDELERRLGAHDQAIASILYPMEQRPSDRAETTAQASGDLGRPYQAATCQKYPRSGPVQSGHRQQEQAPRL